LKVIKPMLCETAPAPHDSPDYLWERKYDGIRMVAFIDTTGTTLQSRSGRDKTNLFPDVKIDILGNTPCILDGEFVSGDTFNGIQHRANRGSGIEQAAKDFPAVYQVFDVLQFKNVDLMGTPLEKRKEILNTLVIPNDRVVVAPVYHSGIKLLETAKANTWEGVIGKNKHGIYREGARDWLKVKIWREGTFFAVGYTAGTGWRQSTFGALVLADFASPGETMGLKYVGQVGTGFDATGIRNLWAYLSNPVFAAACPFPRSPEPATYVRPFQVKVRYMEISNDGMLRFPSFKGVL
jgi:bifunctional non-homologous end joining protein LigD